MYYRIKKPSKQLCKMFMKEAAYYMFGYITQLKLAYTGTMYTEMFVLMHATFIT